MLMHAEAQATFARLTAQVNHKAAQWDAMSPEEQVAHAASLGLTPDHYEAKLLGVGVRLIDGDLWTHHPKVAKREAGGDFFPDRADAFKDPA